ncbi:hypothetical protein J8F10_22430 [Gemmata sp. G18]|uniref:Uncharacterized protein n=1 Tax=Gemmata palustris TaxID=2822762 RepID=A0ABS5BWB8_9BACT|nr:hypothetical protein [Gemmata palustris]MBP3958022.1 hypothetical protein [Gemmata palustris]
MARDRVFVCSGADFETLFPDVFAASGIRRCKLQMMKTRPQPNGWRIGTHLAGGLTLCHYRAFEMCSAPQTEAPDRRNDAGLREVRHPRYGVAERPR